MWLLSWLRAQPRFKVKVTLWQWEIQPCGRSGVQRWHHNKMGALTWGLPWAILWGLECPMDKGCLRGWWGMGSSGSWAETGRSQSHVNWKRLLRSSPVVNLALPSQPEPCTPVPPSELYLLGSVRMVPTPAPLRHYSSPGVWHNQRWSLHSSPQQGPTHAESTGAVTAREEKNHAMDFSLAQPGLTQSPSTPTYFSWDRAILLCK